ncbi:MAG: aminoacetone oxidase family FAD-binding enzyme [Candidatus Daviesbacteria bacterium]|nr:aminoacetone oxidase family FAD-binding enzyme [Candidatus Daviesbacteria bacterium]
MFSQDETFDTIVMGGGASGMMAAGQAASKGKKVLLLEKNSRLGEKLRISGGGRCNITNEDYDLRSFLSHYKQAEDFLYSPFSQFGVLNTFLFFESLGLPLVVQARNRAFPHTEKAIDVCNALIENLKKNGVIVKTNCAVKQVNQRDGKIVSVETTQGVFMANSFIFSTGGVSHPETGSTGDGFRWLKMLGHTVKDPTPTIVPLAVEETWVKELAGVSLSFMKITFYLDGKKQFSKLGKVLFTHFGLSGPLILNSASDVAELLLNGEVTATIDAYPDTDLGAMDNKVVNVFNLMKNNELKTAFKELAPEGCAKTLQALFPKIDFTEKVHSVTRDERKQIVNTLKALPVTITGLMGNDRAVAADGGVILTEVDTKTMRSKILDNLYLTGDLLHINRPSGGYSLQLCWTTGFVAGNSA